MPDTPKARKAIAAATAEQTAVDSVGQRIEQEIRADLLDEEQAAALNAPLGSPALVVIRRHYRPDGRLVAIGIHTHPSDRFSIKMELPVVGGRRDTADSR